VLGWGWVGLSVGAYTWGVHSSSNLGWEPVTVLTAWGPQVAHWAYARCLSPGLRLLLPLFLPAPLLQFCAPWYSNSDPWRAGRIARPWVCIPNTPFTHNPPSCQSPASSCLGNGTCGLLPQVVRCLRNPCHGLSCFCVPPSSCCCRVYEPPKGVQALYFHPPLPARLVQTLVLRTSAPIAHGQFPPLPGQT